MRIGYQNADRATATTRNTSTSRCPVVPSVAVGVRGSGDVAQREGEREQHERQDRDRIELEDRALGVEQPRQVGDGDAGEDERVAPVTRDDEPVDQIEHRGDAGVPDQRVRACSR